MATSTSREKAPWYILADPYDRPIVDSTTISPCNFVTAFIILLAMVIVSVYLGVIWENEKITRIYVMGEDDFSEGRIPYGFNNKDARILLEVTALSFDNTSSSPTGSDFSPDFVPFTVHEFSCPGTSQVTSSSGGWMTIQLCAANPSDCRSLSVNSTGDSTILIRGIGDGQASNQRTYANFSVIEAFTPARDTGIEVQLGNYVERDLTENTRESFSFVVGLPRYNTHVTTSSKCICSEKLCPNYVRFHKQQQTQFVSKSQGAALDLFARIIGFCSGMITVGIPLAMGLRWLGGPKYKSWKYWTGFDQSDIVPLEIKERDSRMVSPTA